MSLENSINIAKEIENFVNFGKNNVEKGTLFCKWILKYMFEQSDDEIEDMCAIDGKDDNSIDASFEEGNTLKLIQAVYGTTHKWSEVSKFILDVKRLLDNPLNAVGNNKYLYEVSYKLDEYQKTDKYIDVYYITNNSLTSAEKEKILYEIEHFKTISNDYSDKINLYILGIEEIKDYIDMEMDIIPKKYRNTKTKLLLKNNFISNITCVAEVELKDFARFVRSNKEYLFYSNIRNYLRSTTVNNGIRDTFRDKPTDFWFYNNGITIVCDDFELQNGCFLSITTPQIVNGCQTANTILNEYINLKDPEKQKNLQGTILVKIIKDKNKRKKDAITQYTNSQNSVSGKDFFALDIFQRKMVIEFEKIGYFYEIQNKSSLAKKKFEITKLKGINSLKYLFPKKFNNVIPVKICVQTFAAGMYFMPGTASSRSGELMVNGKKWGKIFNDNTPEEPRLWLYPFAIMNYAKEYLEYNHKSQTAYKRSSLMFFVACYYRTLVHILKEINIIPKADNVNPLSIKTEHYTKVMEDIELNKEILEFVDEIIKRFMKEKYIKEMITEKYGKYDISNFMKSEIETNEKIRQTIDEFVLEDLNDYSEIKSRVKKLLEQE